MTIRGILFDKDGVLFDFRSTWEVWAERFLLRVTDSDRDRAREAGAAVGFDLEARRFHPGSVVIAGTPQQIAAELAPFVGHRSDLLDVLNDEAGSAPQVEAVPLRPLLERLRARGLQLGVATNDAEAPALSHLRGAAVQDLFDFVAGYDSGFGGKPDPGQLLAFCDQTRLDPASVVMVGDSLHDMKAGLAAGMETIGVLTGVATAGELDPLASSILPDIGHLPSWLDARNPATSF